MTDAGAGQREGSGSSTWVIAREWARENRVIRAGLVYLTFEDRLRDAQAYLAWLNAFRGHPAFVAPLASPDGADAEGE